jgi:hypothetical protein
VVAFYQFLMGGPGMDWKELLAKLKIVDINIKPEGEQVGVINIKVENKTINYNFPSTGTVFVAGEPTPDFEKKVKEEAERRLISLGISPDFLSEGARTEIASLTTAASAADAIKVKTEEVLVWGT